MGILNRRENKKFDYNPRFYKGEGSPFEIKHKFDEHRTTTTDGKGLLGKFKRAWNDYQYNEDRKANKRILYIVAVLVFIFLYLIDFDLSIFTQN